MKWLRRVLIVVLLIVFFGAAGTWAWLKSSAPQYSGELHLEGLHHLVEVYYDTYGIPHIYASDKHDLYLAFGYLHASERLFQMELMRRAGGGRLAELFGHELLPVDRMFRTLGISEYAQQSATQLESRPEDPVFQDISAYLEGVNLFVATGDTPPEFTLAGIPKESFSPVDLYLITGAMAFNFSQAQKTDFILDDIQQRFGEQWVNDLAVFHNPHESFIPDNSDSTKWHSSGAVANGEGTASVFHSGDEQLALAFRKIAALAPSVALDGSNSWVISGSRTASGEVMFCNDTHIGYGLPQTWYEAHLNSPGFEMYGHFLAGIPFALVGRNRQQSWGLTMLLNDDMDFYRETINPANDHEVWVNDHWEEMATKQDTIHVKDGADTTVEVRITRHGPLVNDAFSGMKGLEPVSMFWTYTQLIDHSMEALYGMNNATNMDEFKKALPLIHAPGLSVNYGDREGNIAWWACASLIRRPEHTRPFTLLDGASGKDENLGFIPFESNPSLVNPSSGFIYSANDWPAQVEGKWYPGYYKPQIRADRIHELITPNSHWTVDSMKTVLTDHVNRMDERTFAEMLNTVGSLPAFQQYMKDFNHERVLDFAGWDGNYGPEECAPTFYNRWMYYVLELAMKDEFGPDEFELFMAGHQVQRARCELLFNDSSQWWNHVGTFEGSSDTDTTGVAWTTYVDAWKTIDPDFAEIWNTLDLAGSTFSKHETRREIFFLAFTLAVDELQKNLGKDSLVWKWKKVCTLELKHPLGKVAALRPLFNVGPHEVFGGNETILCSGFTLSRAMECSVYYGSQMRILFDFADLEHGWNCTPSGESGHVMSPHYADQAELYRNMLFRTMVMNEEEVRKGEELKLLP